jgi:hypothetical protein
MLIEWLESLATPCSPTARELGYLHELIAIGARYRRCRTTWAEHLANSRREIIAAIGRTRQRRTAVIIGSGRLLDVPLAELARAFQKVILIDVVHPLTVRFQARNFGNVVLVAADITGTIEALVAQRAEDPLPVPKSFAPLFAPDIDLIVSLNVLSQLGIVPVEWIERRWAQKTDTGVFATAMTRTHLDDLSRCAAEVLLVTDIETWQQKPDGSIVDRQSSLSGVAPPAVDTEWIWPIAPAPESDPVLSECRRVITAQNPGRARS